MTATKGEKNKRVNPNETSNRQHVSSLNAVKKHD